MKLSITVIFLCLVSAVWGQKSSHGGDTMIAHSEIILDFQLRLSTVEHLRNEDALRIADLAEQQENDQKRIADLEKQQQIARRRISDLVHKRDDDIRIIADLAQKQQDDHQRINDLEKKQQDDRQHIADLEKKQQDDHQRIADLEKKQQEDRQRIADFKKKQQDDHQRIAVLENKQQDDHQRIADLENKQQDDHQRITDLVKKQRRISDQKNNHKVREQRRLTNPQEQEHLRKMDHYFRFLLNSLTKGKANMTDGRPVPSERKTNGFGPRPRKSVLPVSAYETSGKVVAKRVSPDNQGMVAFYAALTHSINPVAKLTEIHFDHVVTNIGGSYSGNTGAFTCTRAGVYVFSWTVQVNPSYMYTELVKNGAIIGSAISTGDSPYSGIGGGTVVVQLDHADEVWVRVNYVDTGSYIYVNRQTTTFSGFLLQ